MTSRARRSPKSSAFSLKLRSSAPMTCASPDSRSRSRISSSECGWLPASDAVGTPNGLSSRLPMPLKRSTSGLVAV